MRVVITGFEPFNDNRFNSSLMVSEAVSRNKLAGYDIMTEQLPVSFKRVRNLVRSMLSTNKPDLLIMLGQSNSSACIKIERIAVNLMDSVNPDNDGYCPNEECITSDGEKAYFTNLPVKLLKDALLQKNIPVKVSNSAGLYVCNCTYYEALRVIQENDLKTKALFVHLPKITEEFTLESMTTSVTALIEIIKDL